MRLQKLNDELIPEQYIDTNLRAYDKTKFTTAFVKFTKVIGLKLFDRAEVAKAVVKERSATPSYHKKEWKVLALRNKLRAQGAEGSSLRISQEVNTIFKRAGV